jgi:hypothetical protein
MERDSQNYTRISRAGDHMNSNPQKGAVGVNIMLTVSDQSGAILDLSVASSKKIVFERPNNTTFEKTALFATDGTDGKIYYTTTADDLDQSGLWQLQASVVLGGFTGLSSRVNMRVEKNTGE